MGKRLSVFDVFTIACLTRMMFIPASNDMDVVWKTIAAVFLVGWGICDMIKK